MGYYWIAERVSVVDWRKAIEATVVPKTTDWGPNAKFGYPLHGGTLGLWKGVLPFLGDRVRYHKRAIGVDEEKREIEFSDGTTRSVRPAADDAAARGLRVAPEARARGGARGVEEAPLQPPLLGRRGLEAPVALGQELDLLSRTRRRRSTG